MSRTEAPGVGDRCRFRRGGGTAAGTLAADFAVDPLSAGGAAEFDVDALGAALA
jgi:hypothetical protein